MLPMTQTSVRPRGRHRLPPAQARSLTNIASGSADGFYIAEGRRLVASTRLGSDRIPYPDTAFPVDLGHLSDFRLAWLVSAVGGVLGADRFYLRRPASGTIKLLTLGGAGIWWIADMAAIASGHAVNNRGHGMTGRRSHRAVALTLTSFLAAGFLAVVGPPAWDHVPDPSVIREAIIAELTPPPPPPAPAWHHVQSFAGEASGETAAFAVTGQGLRVEYSISGAGYIYLQRDGTDVVEDGGKPEIVTDGRDAGTLSIPVDPGNYTLIVQSGTTRWSFDVLEYDGEVTVPGQAGR